MADTHETTADIIAEISDYRDPVVRERRLDVRLKAAIARKRGDCAKLYEAAESALIVVRGIIDGSLARRNQSVFDCRDKLKSALAAPPRNCDVGTAMEQDKRFEETCRSHLTCSECPCLKSVSLARCELAWAQMPYVEKEGGNRADK